MTIKIKKMVTKIWINFRGQKKHVCMYGLNHGNSGSRFLIFFVGYGLSNGGVGDHT